MLYPLCFSCVSCTMVSVMHLSVMHLSVMHLSVMHHSVMHLSVMQNIKEQYRKILPLFHFLTPFLFFSYDSELHHSALSSDKWESHPNAKLFIIPINLHHFFLMNLEECVACRSPFKFLVNMSASFSLDLTKMILTIPSSTYSLTNLYLMSTCLVRLVVVTF